MKPLARLALALDAYLLVKQPHYELLRWRDLWSTRRALQPLRELRSNGSRVALIPILGDRVFEIKQQLMLASGLRLGNWRIVIMCSAPSSRWVRRYARAFGMNESVIIRPELTSLQRDHRETVNKGTHLLATALLDPRINNLKRLAFMGVNLGSHVASTYLRLHQTGSIDGARRDVQEALETLGRHALIVALQTRAELERLKPQLMIVNEANYATYGPIVDVAVEQDIPVIQFTQPWRDDALILKRLVKETRRHHPNSLAAETIDWLESIRWTPELEGRLWDEFRQRYSGEWVLQRRNHPVVAGDQPVPWGGEGKRRVVIFSHVLWDANLFYGEDLFDDYTHWFIETAGAAIANTQATWIIRSHPAQLWKTKYQGGSPVTEQMLIEQNFGRLPPHVHLLSPESTITAPALFQSCDVGITVRGTAGLEMPCYGKPVITAGTGRYSGLGFTLDPQTPQEYLKLLSEIQHVEALSDAQTTRAKKHALCALAARSWQMKSFACAFDDQPYGRTPLDHNLSPTIFHPSEWLDADDLARWRNWVESDDIDYLDVRSLHSS